MMNNKLLMAQDIIPNADGTVMSGFNTKVQGGSYYYAFNSGWNLAEEFINEGKIYYVHNFHNSECPMNGHAYLFGGIWVCNECGKNNVGKKWWTIRVFQDGNKWCCVGEGFVNVQESDNYAFGKTRKKAIKNYSNKYKNKNKV